jgi:hypothetical protein
MLVALVCLVQVSLLFIGQKGLGHFFGYRPLFPIGWRIVQILRQRRRKATNTAPTLLSAMQYKQQANPLLSTRLLISKNDKNKPISLLSQHKLARTGRNSWYKFFISRKKPRISTVRYPSMLLRRSCGRTNFFIF